MMPAKADDHAGNSLQHIPKDMTSPPVPVLGGCRPPRPISSSSNTLRTIGNVPSPRSPPLTKQPGVVQRSHPPKLVVPRPHL